MTARTLRFQDLATSVFRCCPVGHPLVVRCAPLRVVAGRPLPFPTLYWLACDSVARQLSELERRGEIDRLQQRLREDRDFHREVAADHVAYAQERDAALPTADRELLIRFGLLEPLRARGIGGIRDVATVKCLHLHYAHHLARGSAIGRVVDSLATIELCRPLGDTR